jgi:hypothetical protein
MLSSVVFSHSEGESKTGLWIKELLEVKHDDNWPVERCFTLSEGQRLQYQFSAPHELKYDVHAHPSEVEGHTTLILEKPQVKLKSSGAHKANVAGVYCFNFVVIEKLSYNWNITLRYQIN